MEYRPGCHIETMMYTKSQWSGCPVKSVNLNIITQYNRVVYGRSWLDRNHADLSLSEQFLRKRLTIPSIRRRSLLVDCWYELQKYVHASGLAQRRAEERGNYFIIAGLYTLLLMCCGNSCVMAVETPSWGAWRDAERSPRYQ